MSKESQLLINRIGIKITIAESLSFSHNKTVIEPIKRTVITCTTSKRINELLLVVLLNQVQLVYTNCEY